MFGSSQNTHYISTVRLRDMRNLIYVVCSLILIAIGVGMMRGDVQKIIYFADPINEVLFTMLMFTLSILVLLNLKQNPK